MAESFHKLPLIKIQYRFVKLFLKPKLAGKNDGSFPVPLLSNSMLKSLFNVVILSDLS